MRAEIETSFGRYTALISGAGVTRLHFPGAQHVCINDKASSARQEKIARKLAEELQAYHAGDLKRFTVAVDVSGHTAFRQRVWRELKNIPYGNTLTYGEVAVRISCRSARAVGQACGANPVPLLVPCHRVVAATGLGGFSGGTGLKEKLLAWERRANTA
jgi:O-6-methylguanine DNA methyltransferase